MRRIAPGNLNYQSLNDPNSNPMEYKKILAPIETDWLAEMKGKGLDGDAVLKRAKQIITAVDG